jgi:hypothetical protein
MNSKHTGGLGARWIKRVDPAASPLEAQLALAQLLSMGKTHATQRHWTDVCPVPGVTFVYWSQRPSVCVVAVDGVVVTILARALCAGTAPRSTTALRAAGADTHRRAQVAGPVATADGRWDGRRDAP